MNLRDHQADHQVNKAAGSVSRAQSLYRHLYARKVKAFQALYVFTQNQCGFCVESGCACKDNICKHVEEQALRRGVQFQQTGHPLRFIGPTGCVVPPHWRETCTIYLCDKAQNRTGFAQARYEKIKRICAKLEWKLLELEDSYGLDFVRSFHQHQADPGVRREALQLDEVSPDVL